MGHGHVTFNNNRRDGRVDVKDKIRIAVKRLEMTGAGGYFSLIPGKGSLRR